MKQFFVNHFSKIMLICNVILICYVLFCSYGDSGQNQLQRVLGNVIENSCSIRLSDTVETMGTGILIRNNEILTCYHLFDSVSDVDTNVTIEVNFFDEQDYWIKCKIKKYDAQKDLALLICEKDLDKRTMSLANENDISMGMDVFAIGNAMGKGLGVYKGIVSNAYKLVLRNEKTVGTIQTDIAIDNGDSGGPVFDMNGKIVGILSFKLVDSLGNSSYASSYAISIKEIIDFIYN